MTCSTTYRQLLDKVVEGKLAASGWEQLRGHLAVCHNCRRQYNRAVQVERLLAGGPRGLAIPAPSELCRLGEAVIAQVQPPARATLWGWLRWAAPALASAALLVVLLPSLFPRGPSASRPPAGQPPLSEAPAGPLLASVQAYCQEAGSITDSSGGQPRVTALVPGGSCGAGGDMLRLAYTSRSPRWPYLFVFGLDQKLAIKWYEPAQPTESVAIRPGARDLALGTIRLSAAHQPGPLRVVGLFSERPLRATEVQSAVQRARSRGKAIDQLGQLEGLPAGVQQSSVLVQLR